MKVTQDKLDCIQGTSVKPSVAWQSFQVSYDFPVYFTERLFDHDNLILVETLARLEAGKRHRCLVFIDEGVLRARPALKAEITAYADCHAGSIDLASPPIPVPGGERIKNELYFIEDIQQRLVDHHIDRHSYVIVIGGGAVLDAVGLVAATTHRGVRLIRVPTTVLAQNDSGVGVKNGSQSAGRQEFHRHLCTALCRPERQRSAKRLAAARKDYRHGRGGEGRADPRRRRSSPGLSNMRMIS